MMKDICIDPEDVSNPRRIYQFVFCNEMNQSFPNIATVYKICLTIPVSSVSTERSFSCVKRIKSYLRSTMGQERLSSLSIINIERTMAHNINIKQIC